MEFWPRSRSARIQAAGILLVFRGLEFEARLIHKTEGHMNIPEEETFGFFDEIG